MGLYDRDYAQSSRISGGVTSYSTVTKIILVTCACYVLDNFASLFGAPANWLNQLFALRPELLQKPWQAYQLLTYGLAHAGLQEQFIWHIGFNMYNLWLFGRALERKLGEREFLLLYGALLALSGLAWVIIENLVGGSHEVIGASGAVVGVVVLFALNFPQEKFLLFPIPIPVPAWLIGLLLVLFDVRGAMGYTQSNTAFTVHLAGAACALAYFFSGVHLARGATGGRGRSWVAGLRRKPSLKLHDPEERYAELDRRADRILEKVHQQGADSITQEERQILDDYSRRLRLRRR